MTLTTFSNRMEEACGEYLVARLFQKLGTRQNKVPRLQPTAFVVSENSPKPDASTSVVLITITMPLITSVFRTTSVGSA